MLAAVVFFACVSPWLVRNYRTFGEFIFIRDNFGAELRLGNGRGADGTWMEYLHPTQDVYAMRQYQKMGELAYIKMRKQQAMEYIRADYARFFGLCAKRFVYFWAGPPKATQPPWLNELKNSLFLASSVLSFWGLIRALRLRKPGAWLLFWLMALYPAIYYVVFPTPALPGSHRTGHGHPLRFHNHGSSRAGLRLILQIDLEHVNLLQLGIKHAVDHYPAALEAMHEIRAIEAKNIFRRSTAPGSRRDAQCNTPNRYSKCRPWTST